MKINFYNAKCQKTTKKELFGLCDDENQTPAYIEFKNTDKLNATVINPTQKIIIHTAIDNCIEILRENGKMDNRCDSMLTYPDNIVFVELKNKGSGWISEGIKQIEATIITFKNSHDLFSVKHKRAFVANRRHPNFQVTDNEKAKIFWDKFRVRLNINSVINIK